jgi:glucose/arabinose dehydrogenase
MLSLLALRPSADARAAAATATKLRVDDLQPLQFPTSLQFTASGRELYVAERSGAVRVIRDGTLRAKAFARVDTTTSGEAGLLGLALDPKFEDGARNVYVFYTLPGGAKDVVERIGEDGSRKRLLSMPSGAAYHHGGILAFGPDGKLYVSNGEAHHQQRAQDPRALGGKIYRIDADGSVPKDDPFAPAPTWSYGHRNPFGLAFDPRTGKLWESENGPHQDDEVNLIRRGANYGWPVVTGNSNRSRFVDPAVDFPNIVVPTGMAFGNASMGTHDGSLFLGTFGSKQLFEFELNGARDAVTSKRVVALPRDGVVGMAAGPDGVYFTTPSGLERLRADPPVRASASATPSASSPSPSSAPATPSVEPTPGTTQGRGTALVIGALVLAAGFFGARYVARAARRRKFTPPPPPEPPR